MQKNFSHMVRSIINDALMQIIRKNLICNRDLDKYQAQILEIVYNKPVGMLQSSRVQFILYQVNRSPQFM